MYALHKLFRISIAHNGNYILALVVPSIWGVLWSLGISCQWRTIVLSCLMPLVAGAADSAAADVVVVVAGPSTYTHAPSPTSLGAVCIWWFAKSECQFGHVMSDRCVRVCVSACVCMEWKTWNCIPFLLVCEYVGMFAAWIVCHQVINSNGGIGCDDDHGKV